MMHVECPCGEVMMVAVDDVDEDEQKLILEGLKRSREFREKRRKRK